MFFMEVSNNIYHNRNICEVVLINFPNLLIHYLFKFYLKLDETDTSSGRDRYLVDKRT